MSYPQYFIKFIDYGIGDQELLCLPCKDKDDLLKLANFIIPEYTKLIGDKTSCYCSDRDLKIVNEEVTKGQLEDIIDTDNTITVIAKYDEHVIDYDRRMYIMVNSLDNLLKIATDEIEKEMKEYGFINDSDNADRFIDDLIKEDLIGCKICDNEQTFNELNTIIHNELLKSKYNSVYEFDDFGDSIYYFYTNDLEFNSIDELQKHFGIV